MRWKRHKLWSQVCDETWASCFVTLGKAYHLSASSRVSVVEIIITFFKLVARIKLSPAVPGGQPGLALLTCLFRMKPSLHSIPRPSGKMGNGASGTEWN